jgi:glutamine amidotransferase
MKTVTIIDYGVGNLGSIQNMLKKIGASFDVATDETGIERAEKLVLPGVGAFDHAMQTLSARGLVDVLNRKALDHRVPILGVCLGMQLLTRGSEEGELPGLGWIPASAIRFRSDYGSERLKVPHMGWNGFQTARLSPLLDGLGAQCRFYFVHSYYVKCDDRRHALASAYYGTEFDCVIGSENVVGAQFHPEKSHRYGLQFLSNFVHNF